jgi:hypothetical protein
MSLPVTVPFTFGNATTTQSLSSLDTNFTTIKNAVNGLTNGASQINVASITATGTANGTTYLRGDGAWATISGGGSGTVTSVNANSTIGFTFTGGPVTSSGTLTLSGPTPGTSGNVLTSNGTAWVSQASASGTVNSVNGFTGTVQSVLVAGTAVATTSGTSINFTGIPSWAKRITMMLNGVSTNGTGGIVVQIGSGSLTTTGYNNGAARFGLNTLGSANSTNGFLINTISANVTLYGNIIISYLGSNVWTASFTFGMAGSAGGNYAMIGGGAVALSGVLDRVAIVTSNGTDTFNAGSINIQYE